MNSDRGGPGSNNFSKNLLILVLVAGISFVIGTNYSAGGSNGKVIGTAFSSGDDVFVPEDVDLYEFWKVWQLLDEYYVPTGSADEITNKEKVWGATEGLARSIGDPYTVFLPPEDSEIFADDISGNFEGVGMEIGMRGGFLTVIAPLKGTPAERAGILAGDTIFSIDGESTDDMSVDGAVKRIRGKGGTQVVLTIAREGENEFLDIGIIRDVIEIPTISTMKRDDGIFVIELYNFSAVSSNLFRDALREFVESGSDELILDLRGNPGGFLEAAVDMASWFLPAGDVVLREDVGGGEEQIIHRSKGYDIFDGELNMVVLIDQGSASASEILAGALREYDIATLIGETSFGKGSVQQLLDVTKDTSLKVTIARWLTPNGVSISEAGLTPDFEVELTSEDFENGDDPQLEKAISVLKSR